MEYETCCGTTCDKQKMSAEFEKLTRERDEALAYAQRVRMASGEFIADCEEVYGEQPPAAVAAIKAQWQAEAIQSILDECEQWSIMGKWGIMIEDISEKLEELYQRAGGHPCIE